MRGIHCGFETHADHTMKSKTEVSAGLENELCPPFVWKKGWQPVQWYVAYRQSFAYKPHLLKFSSGKEEKSGILLRHGLQLRSSSRSSPCPGKIVLPLFLRSVNELFICSSKRQKKHSYLKAEWLKSVKAIIRRRWFNSLVGSDVHQRSPELDANLPVARLLAQKILGGVFHRTEAFVMVNKMREQSYLLQTRQ